ncbi:carboxymuconolactone decarboxylase family protein [Humibacter ginsenosidimutans]|uniref:Carboxymuconolactone decarboxylase family protein n=1 Tax=Humibacter ginsenosidimutans TaxID=2599293 RepID=A0A5B8M5K2_9MICO|nr:carboxymuconolactone decarboxylase family protein [Humibacter ginsenosidimutans]QDZ15224.1 carboxymuconolactone decarboxylase family protein [Humibacter ginsenosidimutans]
MTESEPIVLPAVRFDFDELAPGFSRALAHLDHAASVELDKAEIPIGLRNLVKLRASQLNGCSYCVDLHSRDARDGGESFQRIAAVAVWDEAHFFTARERAAFALTDAVTRVSETHVPDGVVAAALDVYTPVEVSALLALIVSINAWNEVGVTARCWRAEPETEEAPQTSSM